VVADIKEAAFSASAADLINAPSNCAAAFDPLPSLVHVFIIERVFDKSIKKRGNVHDRDAFATHARRDGHQLRIRQNEEQSLELVFWPLSELCGFRPGAWSEVAWIAGLWGAVPRGRPSGGAGLRKAHRQGQAGLVPRIGPETSHAPWFRQQAIM
jgi:hypothetical protein